MLYDVFICHATEDKEGFVRQLVKELTKHHLEVWYDEFSLTIGDSLREKIDEGLAKSRFGIVVLSPHFFKKKWTNRELNGLVARQLSEDKNIILPIWHNIEREEILKYSPPLADIMAIKSVEGLKKVCSTLLKKLRPEESPLIVARDTLLVRGIEPPIISDEWWLDVVEASNRMLPYGYNVPEQTMWGSWSFPLPNQYTTGAERGINLAWTAMQLDWSNYAEENKICQITHPEKVLNYIEKFAGLEEICHEAPSFLACYAPQLTIPEFSGPFSETFDLYLQDSEEKQLEYIGTNYGVSLTTNNAVPLCEVEIAFRHKTFGNYKPETLGNHYINGEMGCPSSKCYNPFEYIVWFLSQDSNWMPHNHKQIILEGIKTCPTWSLAYFNQIDADNVFMNKLHTKKSFKSFSLNKTVKESLEELITLSLENLNLIDIPQVIIEKFLQCGFIEAHYEYKESRKRARKKVA